jgi:hypothetical protein
MQQQHDYQKVAAIFKILQNCAAAWLSRLLSFVITNFEVYIISQHINEIH